METPQITPPQKTSFWDFRNKKDYVSRGEKLVDLLIGIIIGPVLFFFVSFGLLYLGIFFDENLNLFDNVPWMGILLSVIILGLVIPSVLYVILMVYLKKRRQSIYFGMILGLVVIIVMVFFWMLNSLIIDYV